MRIKAILGMGAGAGLVILFILLGVNWTGNHLAGQSALSGGQQWASREDINNSDNGTWLAEYESDGVNGAGGVPAKGLPVGKIVLLALLLTVTGALAAGVAGRKADHPTQVPSDE